MLAAVMNDPPDIAENGVIARAKVAQAGNCEHPAGLMAGAARVNHGPRPFFAHQ